MNYKLLGIFIGLAFILTSFQNCSDVAFQTADSNNQRFHLDDHLDVDLPEVDGDSPQLDDDIDEDDEDHYDREFKKVWGKCFRRGRLIEERARDMGGEDLVLQNKRGLRAYKNIDDLVLRNFRGVAAFFNVDDVEEIQNYRGILKAQAEDMERINNVRGISCLQVEDLDFVDNNRGIQVIVNPNIEELGEIETYRNSRGVLYLENMVVEELLNFRGLVLLKNSSIENVQNVNAVIRDLDSGRRDRVRTRD